jgi:hypothetical protein
MTYNFRKTHSTIVYKNNLSNTHTTNSSKYFSSLVSFLFGVTLATVSRTAWSTDKARGVTQHILSIYQPYRSYVIYEYHGMDAYS